MFVSQKDYVALRYRVEALELVVQKICPHPDLAEVVSRKFQEKLSISKERAWWGEEENLSKPICAYSGKPLCDNCRGAVYRCDPEKNRECSKEMCGECRYTKNIKFAQDTNPICWRTEDEKMLVSKKKWDELEKRVQALEAGENIIATAEHGNHTVRWYIRMLSCFTKADASKLLASWGN